MRLIALDARTGEVLDWDVPVDSLSLTRSLSLACLVSATVPAWYHARTDDGGHPVLLRGGTLLVVEEDDGTLTPALMDGESLADDLEVEGTGLSTLAAGAPWAWSAGSWSGHDALSLWRHVWGRVIGASGVPRLTVTGDTACGVVVGRAPSAEWRRRLRMIATAQEWIDRRDARAEHWQREMDRLAVSIARHGGRKGIGEITVGSEVPQQSDGGSYRMHILTNSDGKATRVYYWKWTSWGNGSWYYRSGASLSALADRWIAAKNTRDNAKGWFESRATFVAEQRAWMDAHPEQGPEHYTLSSWANRDLAADLESLRDLGGFDWVETARWDDQDNLIPQIHAVKTIGSRREDLHFELGVNIHAHPELHREEIATQVTVMGAGEGSKTLSADRAWSHPRLVTRHRTVSDSSLGTRQMVAARADREIKTARAALDWRFTGLTITDTPAAPIGRLGLGDTIRVTGTLADGTDLDQWVRVTEITRTWGESGAGDTIQIEVEAP